MLLHALAWRWVPQSSVVLRAITSKTDLHRTAAVLRCPVAVQRHDGCYRRTPAGKATGRWTVGSHCARSSLEHYGKMLGRSSERTKTHNDGGRLRASYALSV